MPSTFNHCIFKLLGLSPVNRKFGEVVGNPFPCCFSRYCNKPQVDDMPLGPLPTCNLVCMLFKPKIVESTDCTNNYLRCCTIDRVCRCLWEWQHEVSQYKGSHDLS